MKILVLCTGNSCRSQMAEGLLCKFLGSASTVASAGINLSSVHPLAIFVMDEIGIDISHNTSDHVEKYIGETFDYVITVCDNAKENCPVFPGATETLHMPFPDPAKSELVGDELLTVFREVRDEISQTLKAWVEEVNGK